ncbi:MAG: alpha/beta fold hydrolase [Deltaproteobacteria bacterium]|nr:alpha/beta fold hydrolase [Deltaproteobacteria bacterium]
MPRPLFVFAHGAGAPSSSPWMRAWADRLQTLGKVVAFDYPYMAAGRRSPDALPKLIAAHEQVLADARKSHRGPVVLIGKSMGSRVGCHVATRQSVDAIVCLGYPLKGAGGQLRDEVLLALRTPILFVQGSSDALCPLDALKKVQKKMSARNELRVVEDANHSLEVGKRKLAAIGETQEQVDARVLSWIREFLVRNG